MTADLLSSMGWSSTLSVPIGEDGLALVLEVDDQVDVPQDLAALLEEPERRRHEAFVRERDARTYLLAHVALRLAVATIYGRAPQDLHVTARVCPGCGRKHGRPAYVETPGAWLSLSHAQGWVMLAVAEREVGVDVETVPSLETTDVVVGRLHPREQAYVRAAGPRRDCAFARVWSRKEAYLKALGVGLARDAALDDVLVSPSGWEITDVTLQATVPTAAAAAAAVAVRASAGD